jgi:hypothetical protein
MDAASRGEVFGNEVAEELEAFAAVASRILGADEAERIMQTAKAVRSKTS